MSIYRIYFIDSENRCKMAQWFQADDDESAWWLAQQLYDACSDVCASFELWHLTQRIGAGPHAVYRREKIEALQARRQDILIDIEETIMDSKLRISASRRLLEKT
jgi:hypothetical protein